MNDSDPEALLNHLGALVQELGNVSRTMRTLYVPQTGRGAWLGLEGGGELAKFLFEVKQARDQLFDPVARDDLAWDMLLELAKSEIVGVQVSVSNLCAATSRPQTSALRKMNALARAGVVARLRDDRDRRRVIVELTDRTRQAMEQLYQRTVVTNGSNGPYANGRG